MRILFAGTPEPALPSLQALIASDHTVVGVLTRPEAPAGRGRAARPSPVALAAQDAGIPVLTPASLRDPAVQQQLIELRPDVGAVVAYGNLIPRALLDAFPWVNLHFSLLPRWRGAAPVQRAIAAGDPVTGASVFLLEEGLDTGAVIGMIERPLGPTDTAGQVLTDLALSGAALLVAALTSIEDGSAHPETQSTLGVTLAPKIEVAEARVDWAESAAAIDRMVRAVTPVPGAWSELRGGGRVKIGPVTPLAGESLAPGVVRAEKNRVLVGTGDAAVALGQVAPAGKSWMDAAAWGRGLRAEIGFEVNR